MSESDVSYPVVFRPDRLSGLVFHAVALGLLLFGGGYAFWRTANAEAGTPFIIYLVPASLAILLAGQFLFSLYGLWSASYTLDRDGIRLRWGLRAEDIPGNDILWVASEREIPFRLKYPLLTWPGSVVGTRKLRDQRRLVFLAGRKRELALIATQDVIYIVSPPKTQDFLKTFGSIAEQGVIAPLQAHSEDTLVLLTGFWADRLARIWVLAAALLALFLALFTALMVAGRETVVLHAGPLRLEPAVIPAVRLLLLPILNVLIVVVDLALGLFFYRSPHLRPLAFLVWVAAVLSGLLFSVAVVYTLFFT